MVCAAMEDRGQPLVFNLSERLIFSKLFQDLDEKMGYLLGDCLVAAAFLSYMGPFLSNYRDDIVQKVWMVEVCLFDCY